MPGRDDEKVKRPLYLGADNFLQRWAVAPVALIQCYFQANWSAISSQPHQRLNPGRWDVQGLTATQSPTTIVENAAAAMVENAFHLNFDNIYDSSAMRWNQPSAIRGGVDFCYTTAWQCKFHSWLKSYCSPKIQCSILCCEIQMCIKHNSECTTVDSEVDCCYTPAPPLPPWEPQAPATDHRWWRWLKMLRFCSKAVADHLNVDNGKYEFRWLWVKAKPNFSNIVVK